MSTPEYIFPEGSTCEVHTPALIEQVTPLKTALPAKSNLPELYKSLRAAKNKAEAGAAMRKFIAWNDIPSDVWEKIEDWFPIKK